MAEWSTAYVNDLPDSSFAYISPGGKKDAEGKTTPRSLRHLPYKDKDGKVDAAHLRNALARLSQTDIPAAAKAEAFRKLHAAAREVGVDVSEDDKKKFADAQMMKIPVGRIGKWKHPRYGPIEMSQRTFDEMIRNFRSKAIGRDPFIRIGHDKADDPTFGGAKAEGWITDLVQEGDVLYALADPTNPDVAEMVRSKKYRYSSPEYQENYIDKETGSNVGTVLLALSLTNEPFLTRLPEARLLADPADTFYLDHEEVGNAMEKEVLEELKKSNGLLTNFVNKLSEWFGKGGAGSDPNNPTPAPAAAAPVVDEATKRQLAEAEARMKALEEENKAIKLAQRTAEVNAKLQSYINAGIPPAVIDHYRPILLADNGEKTIKLSDDKIVSVSESIYASLDAFPEAGRVKLSQVGQSAHPPKPGSMEEAIKLAEQDMAELGYTKDEKTGKFII